MEAINIIILQSSSITMLIFIIVTFPYLLWYILLWIYYPNAFLGLPTRTC